MSTKPALAMCLAIAAALAGCGGSSGSADQTVDDAAVEAQIKQQLSGAGADVTKVKCPQDVKVADGATFKCKVTWSNGATGKVSITFHPSGIKTLADDFGNHDTGDAA